jgi:hypothetical protein
MATVIEAFGMPARHRHDACVRVSFWMHRQAQATGLTLMALGGGCNEQ